MIHRIGFDAGNRVGIDHGHIRLQLLTPGEVASDTFIANLNGDNLYQRVVIAAFFALCWRVKTFRFTGTVAASWDTLSYSIPDPGQSLSEDFDFELPLLSAPTESIGEDGLEPAETESDILGPNPRLYASDDTDGEKKLLPLANFGFRGIQTNSHAYTSPGGSFSPNAGGAVEIKLLRMGPPGGFFGGDTFGLNHYLYYEDPTEDDHEVYVPLSIAASVGVPSLIYGFSAAAAAVWPSIHSGQTSAGSITLKIHGLPDITIPLRRVSFSVFKSFNPGEAATLNRSFTISGTLEATEFWPYVNSEGFPVFDTSNGERLRDPLG